MRIGTGIGIGLWVKARVKAVFESFDFSSRTRYFDETWYWSDK